MKIINFVPKRSLGPYKSCVFRSSPRKSKKDRFILSAKM